MFTALITALIGTSMSLMAALPASTNYQLNNYGMGSGGLGNGTSTNYAANGITGEVSNVQSDSSNYSIKSGNNNAQQANVPVAPTFTNPANYYNKLKFVVNTSSNPSDATFAIAISSDNFATTQYIQSDDTVGPVLGPEDRQTYAAWGGASGQLVAGLIPSTTYKIKIKAYTGKFTETQYGPTASAATVAPDLTFDIDVAPTNSSSSPPYILNFGNLSAGSVTSSTDKIWVTLDTNAESGGAVYLSSQSSGLASSSAGYTIAAMSADLSAVSVGYGAQSFSVGQASGGPLSATSPYNGASQNVGITDTSLREVFRSSNPITTGRGALQLKAKTQTTTPAASDYRDTITMIAAASF